MRWGKWPFSDLFSVHGWPYRAKNGVRVLTLFPMFPVIFCIFSLRCDHDLSLFYCPYLFTFLIFYYKKSTTQHTTYTLTDTHTLTHTCTPATDRDLESGLSKSNTRENPRKCLKKAKSGESLAKARGNADGQIVRLRRSGERPIEPSGSWFPPKFPSFSRKKANDLRTRARVVLDLFSNFKTGKIPCLLPVNPSSK